MKRSFCFIVLVTVFWSRAAAQNVINTDRPDQSDGTHIVEKHSFQFETGLQFSQLDIASHEMDNVSLFRYGVTKRFEVRLQNVYSVIRDDDRTAGFQPLTISCKNILCKQHGLLPKLTLVSYFHLPVTLSPAFNADHLGVSFTLAARHDLTPNMKIYSNLGINEDQQTTDINYLGAVELNYNITDALSVFTEYFGSYAKKQNASNGMDIGCIYAVRKNFALDLAFGSPTLHLNVNKFIGFGFSTRLPR